MTESINPHPHYLMSNRPEKSVLFLCTGNYYRSRFAEELFNSIAARENIPWQATSRGLGVDTPAAAVNIGPISRHTIAELQRLNAWSDEAARRFPIQCSVDDLANASLVVAVKEAEHRQMLAARFPGWELKCRYWSVHDLDMATPQTALMELTQLVVDLIGELSEDSARRVAHLYSPPDE
jgi:protein-tyrosine-phosphatase